ncbi:MAG: hypothetical protein NVSMB55_02690 [Mycobacteriales bacterium]
MKPRRLLRRRLTATVVDDQQGHPEQATAPCTVAARTLGPNHEGILGQTRCLAATARLKTCQRSGTGGVLLAGALARIVLGTDIVAARFLVVDALHDRAAGFCRHYGFRQIPGTMRLVQKISDVAAALAT